MLATKSVLDVAKVPRLPRNLRLTLQRCYACHERVLFLAQVLRLPRNLCLTLRRCYACHETCAFPCASAAPATKSMPDLAKMLCWPQNVCFSLRKCCATKSMPDLLFLAQVLRLPRNLCLTLRRCYACHETCAFPCASAAPATKSMPDLAEDAMLATKRVLFLAQVLRLPRNLCLTLRRCYACHETCAFPCASAAPATKSMPDLAKMLCLPRNVCFSLRKCCACHEIYA